MIRVLVYGISPVVGGVSEYMMNLFRNIDRKKVSFDFIINGDYCEYEKEINKLGGKVFYITPKKVSLIKNIKELSVIFKRCRYTHKIFYFNTSGIYYILPFLLSKLNKYRIITHAHNTKCTEMKEYTHILHYLNRIIVRKLSDYRFTCSELAGEWVYGTRYYIKNADSIRTINNAVDCIKFKFNKEKRIVNREKLGISEEQLVIGNVGRLDYQKNHNFLLEVFYEAVKENSNIILIIIGDGTLKNELIEKAKKLNISDKVKFLGMRRDIDELMQVMDIFVLPSFFEGFPITLVEAQAAGLKCLVSNTVTKTVALTESVEFNDLNNSAKSWAEKILELDTEKKDNYSTLCQKGFDIKSQVREIQELLLKL